MESKFTAMSHAQRQDFLAGRLSAESLVSQGIDPFAAHTPREHLSANEVQRRRANAVLALENQMPAEDHYTPPAELATSAEIVDLSSIQRMRPQGGEFHLSQPAAQAAS